MPAAGYTINDTFAIDATIPIYVYRLAESIAAHPKPDARLVSQSGEPSDVIFALHAQFTPGPYLYQSTFAFTVPSGDETYGLTTGRMTFDLNNHFERSYGRFTPILELGGGDSTTLVNRQVNKTYTSLGPLAHFQLGLGIDLIRRGSFRDQRLRAAPHRRPEDLRPFTQRQNHRRQRLQRHRRQRLHQLPRPRPQLPHHSLRLLQPQPPPPHRHRRHRHHLRPPRNPTHRRNIVLRRPLPLEHTVLKLYPGAMSASGNLSPTDRTMLAQLHLATIRPAEVCPSRSRGV